MSTERKRDWVDYAGLASQLYQNHQINDFRDKVAAVGQIALAKEMREQQAGAEKQRVDRARDVLFTYCSVFQRLKKLEPNNLRGSLLTAKNLDRYVKNSGLTTGDFPEFDDKQRLTDLKEELREYIDRCMPKMGVEDRENLALCERYYREEEVFERAVKRMKEHEGAQKLFAKYEAVKDAQPYQAPVGVLIVGGSLTLLITALVAVQSYAGSYSPLIAGIVFFGLTILVYFGIQDADAAKAQNAIYQERLNLEEQLKYVQQESPLSAFPEVVTALGPVCDSQKIAEEIHRREQFIEHVGDENADVRPESVKENDDGSNE